jgi:hypothetical protein
MRGWTTAIFNGDTFIGRPVCSACIDDSGIREWIEDIGGDPGCAFCELTDEPTADLGELASFMRERMLLFYSHSIEHLMYISAEGGYQGNTWTTAEVLSDFIGLDFPRQTGRELLDALADAIEPDEPWCEYDPAVLDEDDRLIRDWVGFCELIKYERRFFFHDVGADHEWWDDTRSPRGMFASIHAFIEKSNLVRLKRKGYRLYRARPHKRGVQYYEPHELGPPPPEAALQFNRMNPPGIPMFYGSEKRLTARAEVQNVACSLARFTTTRRLRILDLIDLPIDRGIFSNYTRNEVNAISFLRQFARLISQPIDREIRTVLDYIPTQVLTEYLRDATFSGKKIDGIRFASAARKVKRGSPPHANVVLFTPAKGTFVRLGRQGEIPHLLQLRGVDQFEGTAFQ